MVGRRCPPGSRLVAEVLVVKVHGLSVQAGCDRRLRFRCRRSYLRELKRPRTAQVQQLAQPAPGQDPGQFPAAPHDLRHDAGLGRNLGASFCHTVVGPQQLRRSPPGRRRPEPESGEAQCVRRAPPRIRAPIESASAGGDGADAAPASETKECTDEGRRRDRRDPEARRGGDDHRLPGEPRAGARCRRRHPAHHRAPGAHRHPHGRRHLAALLGAQDRRVRHAAGARHRELLRRHRPGLLRVGADPGDARRLSTTTGAHRAQLQCDHLDAQRRQVRRAAQRAGGHSQRHAPRLLAPAQRARRPGDRRDPQRHLERGGAGAAGLPPRALDPQRPRSEGGRGGRRAADGRQAAGALRRPGHPLRACLAAAARAGRAAGGPSVHQPGRQERLPRGPCAGARVGRRGDPQGGAAFPRRGGPHSRHRLLLHRDRPSACRCRSASG